MDDIDPSNLLQDQDPDEIFYVYQDTQAFGVLDSAQLTVTLPKDWVCKLLDLPVPPKTVDLSRDDEDCEPPDDDGYTPSCPQCGATVAIDDRACFDCGATIYGA